MNDSLPSADLPSSGKPHEISGNSDGPVAAVTLTDSDFEPEPPSGRTPRKPGPGLLEAMLWIVGLVMVQIMGSIPVFVFLVAKMILSLETTEIERLQQDPDRLQELVVDQLPELMMSNMVLLLGTIQVVVVVSAIVACLLRLGKTRRQHLPLRAIPRQHCVMIGLLIFPLMIFCSQLFVVFQQVWDKIVQSVPELEWLGKQGAMNEIPNIAEQASLPFLLLMIAVIPAIAEEIVFRGIIGRGLVARWGLLWGVLLTSMLFAVMHLNPVHVFALLPLAVCMHVTYLSTRSFWAPMIIHFINNAAAAVMMKFVGESADLVEQAQHEDLSWTMLVASGCCVLALISLIWKTRVQFIHADGTVWDPGYPSADIPLPELSTVPTCMLTRARAYVAAAVVMALFAMAFIWNLIEEAASAGGGI